MPAAPTHAWMRSRAFGKFWSIRGQLSRPSVGDVYGSTGCARQYGNTVALASGDHAHFDDHLLDALVPADPLWSLLRT